MSDKPEDARKELLLRMYDQMFNDINRHIIVIWQSVGVIIGAFALLSLGIRDIIPIDLASALIVLLAGWVLAHVYDAGYWYNRNLVIIANIERQFLSRDDLNEVHYYFGAHRPKNKMMTHLGIQWALGLGVAVLVLLYHFLTEVLPGFGQPITSFEPLRTLPYLFGLVVFVYVANLREKRLSDYDEFLKNSPGKDIDASNVDFGGGHGYGSRLSLFD